MVGWLVAGAGKLLQDYQPGDKPTGHVRLAPPLAWWCFKAWWLTDSLAGKLLHDYQHDGPVSSLDFHPSELLSDTKVYEP